MPNAVITLDADALARLTAMRDALVAARTGMVPERWQLLYAPPLAILERDILPRFPAAVHTQAAERLAQVPPVPAIE
ncbi:MAG: hypothetical protein GEU80_15665 [Dehalococcoidia bacterium]|nr:hypothetical protein [Dehalococcoidia bacterium]